MEEFNISPQEEEKTLPVDTAPASVGPVASEQTLNNRSFKVKYGLGDILKKTKEEIYTGLANGEEPLLREQAAGEIDQRKSTAVTKMIQEATANKGSPLTPEETSGLAEIVKNLSQNTDPQTVFEEAYGKQFMAELDKTAQRIPDNVLNNANSIAPEEVARIMVDQSSIIAKRESLVSRLENAEDEIKHQSWAGWGVDQLKFMVPGYHDVQFRDNVEGVGIFAGGGLGQNLEEQRSALLRKPIGEMNKEIDRILGTMEGNPSLQAEFLKSMIGSNAMDRMFDDASVLIDTAGLGIGKGAVNLTKSGIKRVLTTKETQTVQDAATAAKQMARASADPAASKSTIEAHSGDLEESAITRSVVHATEDAKSVPDVTQRGLESLTSTHKIDFEKARSNPGTRGQDIVNRIKEMYDAVGPIMQKVAEISKVERLPEIMSNEVYVRAITDKMKDTYFGMRNAIIDTSKPYKENLAGNWYVDFYLGHSDGTYFTHRSTAENFAKEMGFGDPTIAAGSNVSRKSFNSTYYVPEKAVKTDAKTINPNFTQQVKDGKVSFTMDEKDLVQVEHSTTPKEGYIPVEITGSKTYFGNPLVTVEQQGLGYFVKITKPINETDDVVRDVIASSANTQVPMKGLSATLNALNIGPIRFGRLRTPEETLSKADRANRLIATYAPNELINTLAANSPNINRLATALPSRFSKGRRKWDEFQRVIENGQELWDVNTKQKGYFFDSPEELESAYVSWFKRLPDEDEIMAYFEFKRNMEIDRSFRNMAEHRNQTRVGAQTQKITVTKETENGFEEVSAPEFSGVTRRKLGGSKDNIAIIGKEAGNERVLNLGKMSIADKNDWNKLIQEGVYKLVEVYNPELRELKGFGNIGDERIRFVLARNMESKELTWEHIPRRGGGHVEYDFNYALKQAGIRLDKVSGDNWYEGDITLMFAHSFKTAADFAKKLDHVRKLIKAENEDAAKAYTLDKLHIPWETVEKWFKGKARKDGTFEGAVLSLDQKIQVVGKGESIVGMSDELSRTVPRFRNGMKEGSLARQTKLEFSQERDAHDMYSLSNEGTSDNPLYKMNPAEKVDPVTVMNRGLNSIAKSNYMDDYKTMAVEHWIQQAKPILAEDSENLIRHSPFSYFHEPKYRPNADPILKAQMETARAHILQLIGQPSETAKKLQRISQKLADAGEKRFGPASVLANEWDLAKLSDPVKLVRTMAYHVKMGMANIPGFLVQMGNYSNIFGIAGPKYAAPGSMGAQLHFWSRVNSKPEIIDYMDKLASKFHVPGTSRWRPGEFKEAFEEFQRTGFGNVGGEYASLDDPMNAKLVSVGKSVFEDMSSYFVRNGERNSRYGAWYTAFKEFRDKNPFGRITEADRSEILQRADLLNINMSRASSSTLHTGIMSIPTQFLTYQLRAFELFTSNRLTWKERGRMFFVNSLLYGLPMGVGLTGIPAGDYFRQQMMERGYVVGDNFWKSAVMEGLPSTIGAIISGKGDPKAGTYFDVGSRLGSRGLEFLGGVNNADKSTIDILGGPAWSIVKGTIGQSYGALNVIMNLYQRDSELFPATAEDFTDLLKEITSVSYTFRTLAALNTGRWVSKKEAWLADATPAQAIISGLTSFKDQRINDIQTFRAASADQAAYEKKIEEMFLREYRRGVLALKDGDGEGSKKYYSRANILLHRYGYPEDKISGLISRAGSENQSILDKTEFHYYQNQTNKAQGQDSMIRTEKVKQRQRGE